MQPLRRLAILPLPEKGWDRVVSPSPELLWQGASRDPQGAVTPADGPS